MPFEVFLCTCSVASATANMQLYRYLTWLGARARCTGIGVYLGTGVQAPPPKAAHGKHSDAAAT